MAFSNCSLIGVDSIFNCLGRILFFLTGDEIILFFGDFRFLLDGDFRFLLDGGVKLEGESDNSPCTRSAAESFLFSVSLVFFVAFVFDAGVFT